MSACEVAPYRVSRNAQLYDHHFSVKDQPYSLAHLPDSAHREDAAPATAS